MSEKVIMNDIEDIVKFAAENPEAKVKLVASDAARMIADAKAAGVKDGVAKASKDTYGLIKGAVNKLNFDKQAVYDLGFNRGFLDGVLISAGLLGILYFIYKVNEIDEEGTE